MLLADAFNVREGEEATQAVLPVYDQQFVGADVICEKAVGAFNGIRSEVRIADDGRKGAWGHDFEHLFVGVPLADDLPGPET
jgi:hypothetical protein